MVQGWALAEGLSQISGVDGSAGMAVDFTLRFGGDFMILSAIAEKLKRRSKDDFKGRHFQASLILQVVCWYLRYPLSYRDIEELFRAGATHEKLKVDQNKGPAAMSPHWRGEEGPFPNQEALLLG